jgi:hypothetical protein
MSTSLTPAAVTLVLVGSVPVVLISNWFAERESETISITELEPHDGTFIGKSIKPDGSVSQYPTNVKWWKQSVAVIPATIPALFAYLCEARKRNICLIRGAPANLKRQRTRRQKAGLYGSRDRGNHGFNDEPTKLLWLDVDGVPMQWLDDPEGAVEQIVAQLGEPWCSTSCMWFFSASHGLEFVTVGKDDGEKKKKKPKRWTSKISNDKVRVRLGFITDRALIEREAISLTNIAKVKVPQLDRSVSFTTQPNYIARPHWVEHPDRDPLGDIPTIGRITGAHECLVVPDDLAHQARWAAAQGLNAEIADHPSVEAAVRGIGSDGSVRSHLMSAVMHLLIANQAPEVVSFLDHSIGVVDRLRVMVEQHREQIITNLKPFGRGWGDVLHYLPDNMIDWAHWLQDHPAALNRKTIKLIKEETKAIVDDAPTLEAICERVRLAIERARKGEGPVKLDPFEAYVREIRGAVTVELIPAPTGSRKSTLMRAAAVLYVAEHPGKTVVILIPRHDLGNEQIKRLMEEHPGYGGGAAIWRGRHADDPDAPDPQHPGKFLKMCQRDKEAEEIEEAKLDVERSLCKRGRGKKAVKCPLYDGCAYQGQKEVRAGIWFAAHEVMVHRKPKALGAIGWVMIDESPIDAFIFGVDEPIELPLDKLRDPTPPALEERDALFLRDERDDLYRVLDTLKVPIDRHKGVPVMVSGLSYLASSARRSAVLELKGKVDPRISPAMTPQQVKRALESAKGNDVVFTRKLLWDLVAEAGKTDAERCGRVQVHRSTHGRVIRMCGLHRLAKGWNVQTLICDATGDATLLQAIWPWLQTEAEPWPQLPRPASVKVFQIVDRSISKYAVAVESKLKEGPNREKDLERKGESARRMYAALLMKAMVYGGADVAAIVYKSTRKWIEDNCFVPDWLKLAHHGNVTGTNIFENVRALFEVGRMQPPPEAMVRQTEAMFGGFISQREYTNKGSKGRIPIVPDEAGNTAIDVDLYRHRHPMVQRLLRQTREGGGVQTAGRARAGLRNEASPLDLHRWTDLPVPELGPIVPVLWEEVEAGLDGLMFASGGIWLESIPDAAEAFEGLFTVNGLKKARKQESRCNGEGAVLIIDSLLAQHPHRYILEIRYMRSGPGRRLVRALSLRDPAATRAWLEAKLGPLVRFEAVEERETRGRPMTSAERVRAYRARRAA